MTRLIDTSRIQRIKDTSARTHSIHPSEVARLCGAKIVGTTRKDLDVIQTRDVLHALVTAQYPTPIAP